MATARATDGQYCPHCGAPVDWQRRQVARQVARTERRLEAAKRSLEATISRPTRYKPDAGYAEWAAWLERRGW